ncbi:MAG: hypothetical protein WD738_18000 [Pirellulales bacterium]
MRRAGQKRIAVRPATSVTPTAINGRHVVVAELDFHDGPAPAAPFLEDEAREPSDGTFAANGSVKEQNRADRHQQLQVAIRQRIESRLPGRVRDLVVRVFADTVLLEGQCATYYSKQLAQHAAMGVLEEGEHLKNSIVVNVAR